MTDPNQKNIHPWFKEPIVWLAIAIPLSAVIYGIFYLTVSITSFDGMVVDDYYKVGKQINRVLQRDRAASTHALNAQVAINEGKLTVFLASGNNYTPPPALEIKFIYSTRADIDKTIFVDQSAPGIYKGTVEKLETGRWNVQIEADDWRLMGSMRAPGEKKILIRPQAVSSPAAS